MKVYLFRVFLVIASILLPVNFVFGASLTTGGEVNINKTDPILENTYLAGGKVNVDTDILSDLSVIGGEITINSNISGDLIVIGGDVNVNGKVQGDVRIAGGKVYINNEINGDLVILGGEIYTNDNSLIKGESIILGGKLDHKGSLNDRSKLVIASIFINGKFDGYSEITTQNIHFGPNSVINGDFKYYSPNKGIEDNGSRLDGNIYFNRIESIRDNGFVKQTILNFITFWILLKFITTLIIAFILVYIFRVFSQKVVEYGINTFGKSLLIGVLFSILTPILSILLSISLIALPLGFLLMLMYIFILILSSAVSSIIVGNLLKNILFKSDNKEIDFKIATMGVVALTIIQFIPILGDLVRIIFTFVAIGSIVYYVYMNIRWRKIS